MIDLQISLVVFALQSKTNLGGCLGIGESLPQPRLTLIWLQDGVWATMFGRIVQGFRQ